MTRERGASLAAWAGGILLVVVLAVFLRHVLRSEGQILSEAVDDARDALVEKDDEAFLGFFAPDVTYQTRGGMDSLRRDLARWHGVGVSDVYIVDRTIELEGERADIHLVVAVGHGLLDLGQVDVDLVAEKDEGGRWRVRTFSWQHP